MIEEKVIKNYLNSLIDIYRQDKFPFVQKVVGIPIAKGIIVISSKDDCLSRIKGICSVMGYSNIEREYDNGTIIKLNFKGDNDGK